MSHPPPFLPYGRQWIDESDIAAVTAVLRGDWLTQGPAVERFERVLADYTGAAHAVACATGTAALHLACMAIGLQPGDAAIVPTVTFLATASAVRLTGAEVAFADVDPATGLATAQSVRAAARRAEQAGWRVRALIPVHLAGQTTSPTLVALARERGWHLIEDACHAVGGHWADGRPVGAGDGEAMTCFSFHPVKTIAAGEGGAVTTDDPELAKRLRRLCNHGMIRPPAHMENAAAAAAQDGTANPWYYEMPEIGLNYRLSDLHAALAASQMARISGFVARRRALMERYRDQFAPFAPRIRLIEAVPWCRPAWHLCVARIDFTAIGLDRAAVMARLRDHGIGTQVHYIPVHRQPYWYRRYGAITLPGADAYYAAALSLPLYPAMADGDVDRVTDVLADLATTPA